MISITNVKMDVGGVILEVARNLGCIEVKSELGRVIWTPVAENYVYIDLPTGYGTFLC